MRDLVFGLVGFGAWGNCHAHAIRETPGCELRAVCAQTADSRARAAQETRAWVTDDYRELAARADLDAVDIVVPNFLHEQIAVSALGAGKHVLLEKPMATSLGACDRIAEAARLSGRCLLIGHEMRFSPLYRRMREILDSGELGESRYLLIDLWRRP